IVSVPTLSDPPFVVVRRVTVPLPLPLAEEVIVIHAALVEAVHAQPGPELIETLPELAVEGNDSVSGETTGVQAPGWLPEPCVTVNFSPATWIAPVRAPAEFGGTSKGTAPP